MRTKIFASALVCCIMLGFCTLQGFADEVINENDTPIIFSADKAEGKGWETADGGKTIKKTDKSDTGSISFGSKEWSNTTIKLNLKTDDITSGGIMIKLNADENGGGYGLYILPDDARWDSILYKYKSNGTREQLGSRTKDTFKNGQSYDIEFSADGENVTVKADESELYNIADSTYNKGLVKIDILKAKAEISEVKVTARVVVPSEQQELYDKIKGELKTYEDDSTLVPDKAQLKAILSEISKVTYEVRRNELQAQIDKIVSERIKSSISADYDRVNNKIKIEGSVYSVRNKAVSAEVIDTAGNTVGTLTLPPADEIGEFSSTVDFLKQTPAGSYKLKVGDAECSFEVTLPSSDGTIKSFKIDGVQGTVSNREISVVLSSNSALDEKTVIFELTDAKAHMEFADGKQIISGVTKIDVSKEQKLFVVAENGTKTEYTLKVSKSSGNQGGGTGGGTSGRGSGGHVISGLAPGGKEPAETVKYFDDLDDCGWAEPYINSLYTSGVINGVSDRKYDPNGLVTRAEFVKMAVGAFEIKNSSAECNFDDVDRSDWAYPFIAAAVEEGIVKGESDFVFGRDNNILRQDAAVILHRITGGASDAKISFSDAKNISDYAIDAVGALYSKGIMTGDENNCFNPLGFLTRAEAAKIICLGMNG